MQKLHIEDDLTARLDLSGRGVMSGTLYLPEQVDSQDSLSLLVLVHGGSYSRHCPVLVVQSEIDMSTDHHAEVAPFSSSSHVSLVVAEGAAHCANFSSRRHVVWDSIMAWIPYARAFDRSPVVHDAHDRPRIP